MSVRLMIVCVTALGMLVTTAGAEPYWIAYEGNDFPENEGWERYITDPPAERWLENGSFFMDSRADPHTTDSYGISFEEGLDPESGEIFVSNWGLRIEDDHLSGSGIAISSDDHWAVSFLFDEDTLMSVYEPNVYVELEPAVNHEYELRSDNMRDYELYIDDELAIVGVFFESLSPISGVAFGDIVHGGASLAAWDYIRFGVVPEPATWLMITISLPFFRGRSWYSKAIHDSLN